MIWIVKALKIMIRLLIGLLPAFLMASCGQDKPQIDYSRAIDTTSVADNRITDSTKVLVAELPIKFDSTDVLLFAIGLVDLQERGGYSKLGSGSYSDVDIASSYFNRDHLTGNFINIVFQDTQGKERKLTDKKIRIRNVNFLRDVFKRTKAGYLLYTISDRDSDRDGVLSHSDLEALYISRIDGSGFKKVTKELHEFYDWSLIKGEDKVYFRTLVDSNRDGELTNKDKFHYYLIEFSGDSYSLTEYNPTKTFE
ncbi:hypothetical protein D770_05145 [Flammeovirgaceae bacterium 311]|nr:hypothetical protein D770_05145 [Flammeovirgaceae bacterium 311]